jgi:hypothetical protein
MSKKKYIRIMANEDAVIWHGTDCHSSKITKQMKKICEQFGLTEVEWSGRNTDHSNEGYIQCVFEPVILVEKADEFMEYVEGLNK